MSEAIVAEELAELEGLVDRAGWPAAQRLLRAVTGLERREELRLVTHRELQSLRIALTVAAEADPAAAN